MKHWTVRIALRVLSMPYWLAHALISLAITAVALVLNNPLLSMCMTGAMFYMGREIAQYEEKKYFDWKGLVAPIVASLLLYLYIQYIHTMLAQ